MKFPLVLRSVLLLTAALFVGTDFGRNVFAQSRSTSRPATDLTDFINAMQFSADGQLLAIARGSRDDNRVELWETATGKLRRTIRGFDGTVWSVSFTPNGNTLVTASGGVHLEKVAQKPRSRNGRSFTELKWWDPMTGDLKQRVELPSDEVASLAALHSPDGRLLATVENRLSLRRPMFESISPLLTTVPMATRAWILLDSDLKLLDAATGEVRIKLKDGFAGLQAPIYGGIYGGDLPSDAFRRQRAGPIRFSPDGQIVAAWSSSEARLWNTNTGAELLKLKKFKGNLSVIAFSPDSKLLAGAVVMRSVKGSFLEQKSELHVWDVATGASRGVIPLNTQSVTSMTFANNGHQVIIGGLQNRENHTYASMELADLEQGSLGKLIANDEGTSSSICLSPDGETMAFQIDATTVKLVEMHRWRTRFTLGAESASSTDSFRRFMVTVNSVPAVTFLGDEKTVAAEIENGGIKVWDARTGEARKKLALESETGTMATISADGFVAEVGPDGTVRAWNVAGGEPQILPGNGQKISAIAMAGESHLLAVAYQDAIVLTDAATQKTKRTINGTHGIDAVALSADGSWLAWAGRDGQVAVHDVETGAATAKFISGGAVTALQFAPQGHSLAVGYKNGNVAIWTTERGELLFEARKHDGAINAITFSKDGTLMATGGDDRIALIWEVSTRKVRRTLKGHDLVVSSLAFSPDNQLLAVGSGNASIVLWDVATGKLNRVMK